MSSGIKSQCKFHRGQNNDYRIYNKDDNKYLTTEFIQQQTPPP